MGLKIKLSEETFPSAQKFVSEFSSSIEGKYADKGVRVVILGSYLRRERKPGSDLDIVIYADRRLSMREKAEIYRTFVTKIALLIVEVYFAN